MLEVNGSRLVCLVLQAVMAMSDDDGVEVVCLAFSFLKAKRVPNLCSDRRRHSVLPVPSGYSGRPGGGDCQCHDTLCADLIAKGYVRCRGVSCLFIGSRSHFCARNCRTPALVLVGARNGTFPKPTENSEHHIAWVDGSNWQCRAEIYRSFQKDFWSRCPTVIERRERAPRIWNAGSPTTMVGF